MHMRYYVHTVTSFPPCMCVYVIMLMTNDTHDALETDSFRRDDVCASKQKREENDMSPDKHTTSRRIYLST